MKRGICEQLQICLEQHRIWVYTYLKFDGLFCAISLLEHFVHLYIRQGKFLWLQIFDVTVECDKHEAEEVFVTTANLSCNMGSGIHLP